MSSVIGDRPITVQLLYYTSTAIARCKRYFRRWISAGTTHSRADQLSVRVRYVQVYYLSRARRTIAAAVHHIVSDTTRSSVNGDLPRMRKYSNKARQLCNVGHMQYRRIGLTTTLARPNHGGLRHSHMVTSASCAYRPQCIRDRLGRAT